MGSLWGLAGTAVLAVGFALRTLGEEKVLRADLEGYEAYTKATPWRAYAAQHLWAASPTATEKAA